jgi:hypothetical protein
VRRREEGIDHFPLAGYVGIGSVDICTANPPPGPACERVVRMPHANIELVGWEQMRAFAARRDAMVEYFVQNTHPGVIRLGGDTATGRPT